MSFERFKNDFYSRAWPRAKAEGQRKGQAAYNHLWLIYPEMAKKIAGSKYDPFYQDSILPLFWTEVACLFVEKGL